MIDTAQKLAEIVVNAQPQNKLDQSWQWYNKQTKWAFYISALFTILQYILWWNNITVQALLKIKPQKWKEFVLNGSDPNDKVWNRPLTERRGLLFMEYWSSLVKKHENTTHRHTLTDCHKKRHENTLIQGTQLQIFSKCDVERSTSRRKKQTTVSCLEQSLWAFLLEKNKKL